MAKKSDILIVCSKTIIMNIRKKIVNISSYFLILFIIVSAFIFFPRSKANATLILCANPQSKVFVVIDDQYTCPPGYNLVDDEYNLRQSGYTQDVTYDPTNPTINNNSNNNPVVTTTTVNNGVVVSGNANASTNNIVPVVTANNYENTIMPDPSLASGPFLNLDPTDYPYCLSLSHDLSYGIRDSNTGGEVSAIQSYLTDRGFLETGATGFYGRATEMGVKRFQYRNELSVTGTVTVETRDILKELTCVKYPKVTYVDKPLSPSKNSTKINTSSVSTTKKTTVIPTTKATPSKSSTAEYTSVTPTANSNIVIPPTTTQTQSANSLVLNNNKLSSLGGTISLSKGNNLFFTFSSNSSSPSICINLGSSDCSKSSSYSPVSTGVNGSFYEATSLSSQKAWAFTIYGNRSWGSSGSKVNIFLKDSPTSNTISVYTIIVAN